MKDQFYVTLPSNSSKKYYGVQSMSNYKTMLCKPLQLNLEEWEVGLAELIFPHSWKNVSVGRFRIKMLEEGEWKYKNVDIPETLYSSKKQLIDTMNEYKNIVLGEDQKSRIQFIYHEVLNRVVTYVSEGYSVIFDNEQSTMLGFGDNFTKLVNSTGDTGQKVIENRRGRSVYDGVKIIPPFIFDLNRGLHTFFVYCDVIDGQLVGDTNVRLLRTVPVSGKNGEIIAKSFDNIHYVSLNRSTFQEIEIQITDDLGRNVQFAHGRVIVKLHFRRK